jgi:hypothetical protein
VINSGWVCEPGEIFADVLKMYAASGTMKHMAFFPPFLWEGKLETLDGEPWRLSRTYTKPQNVETA